MPLDIINDNGIAPIPENLDFNVSFEPTKVSDKKYVINNETGEYLGVVGNTFNCASHTKFFQGVQETIVENLLPAEVQDAKVYWKDARNNAWALMDITLPNVKTEIVTDKHSTTVSQRIIALHGIDGSCSNMVFFGAIDFFCTNGMISGEHEKIRRKNTSNFSMDRFIQDLRRSQQDFYKQSDTLKTWARKNISPVIVQETLEKMFAERKAEKMFSLYNQEADVRGHNVFALYSAFTNYATYADERNGFNLRNTANDTEAVSMFNREHEVAKWIQQPEFKALAA